MKNNYSPPDKTGLALIVSSVEKCQPFMTTRKQVEAWFDKPEVEIFKDVAEKDRADFREKTISQAYEKAREVEDNAVRLVASFYIRDPKTRAHSLRAAAEDFTGGQPVLTRDFTSPRESPSNKLRMVELVLDHKYTLIRPDTRSANYGFGNCEVIAEQFMDSIVPVIEQQVKILEKTPRGR